jgi:ABC-2 type transport system permease protein
VTRRRPFGVVGLVAEREIRQRLRGRVFRVATALLLLGVGAAIVLPVVTKGKSHPQQLGVVGVLTPALRQAITTAGTDARTRVHLVTEPGVPAARAALRSGRIDVALIGGRRLLIKRALTSSDTGTTARLAHGLAQVIGVNRAVQAARLTAAQRAQLARAAPLPIAALEPQRTTNAARETSTIGMIVLFILLTQYLSWTLIGVMEEKSSRVVEVLLAAVRPLQLLAGKVLGIGVVVFAQAAIVGAFALILGRAVGSDVLHGSSPLVLLSVVVWLLLGYAFYSWLYAAAGSMAERQDQVQSLAIPLTLPLIAGYILGIAVVSSGDPAPLYIEVLAYVPPTAPFAMTTLVGLGGVTWWQFALSVLVTLASVVVVARLAAGVYRRAILRTGRRVRLREVVPGPEARSGTR